MLRKILTLAYSKDDQLNLETVSVSSADDAHTEIFSPSLQDNLFCEDRDEFISRVSFRFRYDVVIKS